MDSQNKSSRYIECIGQPVLVYRVSASSNFLLKAEAEELQAPRAELSQPCVLICGSAIRSSEPDVGLLGAWLNLSARE